MKLKILATMPVLALAAACSQSNTDEVAAEASDGAVDALSGEAGIAMAANCHAQLNAASRLYSALAEQSTGADRQDLANRAISRELAASQYQTLADRLAAEAGQSSEATSQAFRQAEEAISREFDTREFEDFAVWRIELEAARWVGAHADKCPPPDVG